MSLKPVSGKIESQELNDNFSYLDTKTNQISGGPIDTVTSETELNNKYPDGANGPIVVLESDGVTGYLYTWNANSWKRGAIYQSQGIENRSLTSLKLADSAVLPQQAEFIQMSNNILNEKELLHGKNILNDGTVIDSSTYSLSEKYLVTPGQKYTVSNVHFFAEYDAAGDFVNRDYNPNKEGEFTYTVPQNVYFIIFITRPQFGNAQVNKGTRLLDYDIYGLKLKNEINPLEEFMTEQGEEWVL